MSMVYRAKYVLPMGNAEPIEDGEVWIENGRIREVGQGIAGAHPELELCDLGRTAVLPGFVNAHCHIEPTLRRNSIDGLNLWDWLRALGFRRHTVPSTNLLLASARLGAAECAESGITCIGDCTFSGVALDAVESLGLRGIVYREVFGQSMGDQYEERMALAVDEAVRLQKRCSARLKIGLSPHSVYTSTPQVLNLCAESCAELHIPISVHLAETSAEIDYTMRGTGLIAQMRRECFGSEPMVSGLRPVRVLEESGLLRSGVTLAHCVHLTQDEIGVIAGSGAGVANCARSNAFLGAGIAPVVPLLNAGARVGLGTDSAASCLGLDFFEEMRFAIGLHRAQAQDAGAMLAKDVLRLATQGGADALGLGDEIGRLEPRLRADMIAVSLGDMLPGEDVHLAVLSGSPANVVLRLVDGEPVTPDVEARTAELAELMEQEDIA